MCCGIASFTPLLLRNLGGHSGVVPEPGRVEHPRNTYDFRLSRLDEDSTCGRCGPSHQLPSVDRMMIGSSPNPHRDLHSTLSALLRPHAAANPAADRLVADYATYHATLAILAAGFLLVIGILSVLLWRRFRRATTGEGRWSFERRVYFWFAALGLLTSAFLVLVLVANVSNARNPRAGLAGSLSMLQTRTVGSPAHSRYQAYESWLESKTSAVPPPVQQVVDARLSWQRPKAIVSTVALLGMIIVTLRTWRTLIRQSRRDRWAWHSREVVHLAAGVGSAFSCLLLMVMVMGNTQAAIAPLSMSMFFG
jgi:hypothetical protein